MHTKFKMTANFVVEEDEVDRKKSKKQKKYFYNSFCCTSYSAFCFRA